MLSFVLNLIEFSVQGVPMLNVQNVVGAKNYSPNFRAGEESSLEPKFKIPDAKPDEVFFQKVMEEQQAKMKKEERNKKIALISQIGVTGAFLAIAGISIYQFLKGRGVAKTEFKKLTGNMPSIMDDCVSDTLRNIVKKEKSTTSASKEVLDYVGISYDPKMFLFWGPTGTGKTFSAKMFAKEMGANYGEVQFSDLSSPYIGETAVKISAKFKEIHKLAKKNPKEKYVMTFNEIDSLINNVEKLGANNRHLGENRTAFLNGLDLVKDLDNLYIIGTTNINPHTANLDQATLGRLGNIHELGFPSIKEIKASIKYHFGKSKCAETLLKNDTEMEELAKMIYDKKGTQRDVEFVVNDALKDFRRKLVENGNNTTEVFTKDDLINSINRRDVWAASIPSSATAGNMVDAQYLERQDLISKILKMFSEKKPD